MLWKPQSHGRLGLRAVYFQVQEIILMKVGLWTFPRFEEGGMTVARTVLYYLLIKWLFLLTCFYHIESCAFQNGTSCMSKVTKHSMSSVERKQKPSFTWGLLVSSFAIQLDTYNSYPQISFFLVMLKH